MGCGWSSRGEPDRGDRLTLEPGSSPPPQGCGRCPLPASRLRPGRACRGAERPPGGLAASGRTPDGSYPSNFTSVQPWENVLNLPRRLGKVGAGPTICIFNKMANQVIYWGPHILFSSFDFRHAQEVCRTPPPLPSQICQSCLVLF